MLDKLGGSEMLAATAVSSVADHVPWDSVESLLSTAATALVAYLVRCGVVFVKRRLKK